MKTLIRVYLDLHCLPRPVCAKTLDHYDIMVNMKNSGDGNKSRVIVFLLLFFWQFLCIVVASLVRVFSDVLVAFLYFDIYH